MSNDNEAPHNEPQLDTLVSKDLSDLCKFWHSVKADASEIECKMYPTNARYDAGVERTCTATILAGRRCFILRLSLMRLEDLCKSTSACSRMRIVSRRKRVKPP